MYTSKEKTYICEGRRRMERSGISRATMGRLPAYLTFVRGLPKDVQYISATAVAKGLDLGEVQVRKDLSAVCGTGRPKIGYDVAELSDALETVLGIHTECEAVIVGAGKLGMALLGFGGFTEYGITISRAFDKNVRADCKNVLPVEELPSYCTMHQVEVGIIAVPSDAAQEVADLLVRSGVKAIWCFATVKLHVPDGITVQYENIALSLAHLHQKVKNTH